MANASTFTTLTLFNLMLFGMLLAFGQSVPSFQAITQGPANCINDITTSCRFPQFSPPRFGNGTKTVSTSPPFPQCLITFGLCSGAIVQTVTDVATATFNGLVFIGYGIAYLGLFAYAFFQKIISGFQIIFLTGNTLGGDFGVPFFGNIVIGFFIINLIFGITLIRGNPSGV